LLAPRSLLVDHANHPGVVMNWRVRWDVPLGLLLRRVIDGDRPGISDQASSLDLLVTEAGPAALQR
jgi:hypothetical protein